MTALCIMLGLLEGITCYPPVLDRPQVNAVLTEAGWPEHLLEEAAAVAYCESRWTPAAQNGVHLGLFQANFYWDGGGNPNIFNGWARWVYENHGVEGNPYDPVYNAWVARLIYERNNGWTHNWPNCRPN